MKIFFPMNRGFILLAIAATLGCSTPSHATSESIGPNDVVKPCAQDEKKQAKRAAELQTIVNADQKDRENWQHLTAKQMAEMSKRDIERRKRVGEIFGEGCFKTAADYSAAALVFQHGDMPDHFYQTFIWAKRAGDLGDTNQNRLMALGLDRYLVKTGRKQLFATQAFQEKLGGCYCLQEVEGGFPDDERLKYAKWTLADALKWVDSLNEGKSCGSTRECDEGLKPTPQGSIPGFW